MDNQDKSLPTKSPKEKKFPESKEDQEIIAQVKKMPISDEEKITLLLLWKCIVGPFLIQKF